MTQPELFTSHQNYALAVHNYHLSRSQKLGLMGEKFIASELTDRGYTANLVSDFNASFDILVNDSLPIEVKVAKRTSRDRGRERYQFKLTSKLHRQDYIFCLVAIDDNGELFTFVIPSAFIGDRQTISLTSHPANSYKGQWAKFLNAWDWLPVVSTWRTKYQQSIYGQMSIFDSEVVQ
jgi:hypothetical protein